MCGGCFGQCVEKLVKACIGLIGIRPAGLKFSSHQSSTNGLASRFAHSKSKASIIRCPVSYRIIQNGLEQSRDFIKKAVALLVPQRSQNGLPNVSSHARIPVGSSVWRGSSCTL